MTKKAIASYTTQAIYSVLCIVEIFLCILYQTNADTALGDVCANLALPMLGVLFAVLALPITISLVFNISMWKQETNRSSKWLTWTILSPILYIGFFCIACIVFVSTTGGV